MELDKGRQSTHKTMKAYYQSPIGDIELRAVDGYITSIRFVSETAKLEHIASPLLLEATKQLAEYFAGERMLFDFPIRQSGTPFQEQVWLYLQTIPYGSTISYQEEAIALNNPQACRAVGSANGKNALAIVVPCHRVINANKALGGYAFGIDKKAYLLEMEKNYKKKAQC